MTTSSNIIYYEIGPKPVTLRGDVNADGQVSVKDVTDMIDYLMGATVTPFNKFNADADDNNKHSVADVTAIIDYLMSGSWN